MPVARRKNQTGLMATSDLVTPVQLLQSRAAGEISGAETSPGAERSKLDPVAGNALTVAHLFFFFVVSLLLLLLWVVVLLDKELSEGGEGMDKGREGKEGAEEGDRAGGALIFLNIQ